MSSLRCAIALLLASAPTLQGEEELDAVVYGATPSGIFAAISLADQGHSVALIDPLHRIGGMMTCGLSWTDFRTFESLNGLFRQYLDRVVAYYRKKYGKQSPQVKSCFRGAHAEPKVTLKIFEQMLAEHPGIKVLTRHDLTSVKKSSTPKDVRIEQATFLGPKARTLTFKARVFIDATYEGDLMAMAGVPYRIGRESKKEYGESLAGDAQGQADAQVQGYNFRLIMTRSSQLRILPSSPKGYQRDDFAPVLKVFQTGRLKRVFSSQHNGIFRAHLPALPNEKVDINDTPRAPVRLSMPDINDRYPNGNKAIRLDIFNKHRYYTLGLLYFLQNDAAVPPAIQKEARQWGFCKDEFPDTQHFPPLLYIREARRMVGQATFTEKDVLSGQGDIRAPLVSDAIAIGDYIPNCHGTGRIGSRFQGKHTGEFYRGDAVPYQIPYGIIVPKKVRNLLVPVAVSASHVGFCALRYEPIWAAMGQAAGLAAHLSLKKKCTVQKVPIQELQALLHKAGATTLYVSDVPATSRYFRAVQYFGLRGAFHGMHNPQKEKRPKWQRIYGQYSKAFPWHSAELSKPINPRALQQWQSMLAKPLSGKLEANGRLTRGEALMALYRLASSR